MFVFFVLIVQSLMSSGTHIVAKLVVADIESVTLTFVRSAIAAVALFAIVRARRTIFAFAPEDRLKIFLLSVVAIPVNQFLFLTAIRHTTAANASLMYGATPAVVLVISSFNRHEKLTFRKTLGVAIAFLGIMIVIFERGVDLSSEYVFGNVLMMVAVIAWALYTVYGRPMILKYGAFPVSAATMILGALLFVPIGLYNTVKFPFHTLTLMHWAGLFYLSLITSIFAYFLWYYALGKIEASKVAIFSNLQPIMTTIMAVVFLGQVITPQFLVGGTIALAGVVLTQFG